MNREQTRKTPIHLMVAIVLVSAAVFALDLLLPLGVADGVLYVAPVALSLWLPGRRHTIYVAVACAILTLVGFFLSPPGNELLVYVLLNRAYSLFAIGMMLLVDRLQRQLVRRNSALASQAATLEGLQEQLRAMSALEERQRLAREMHDGLAQVLGSLTARALATSELLAQGKILEAQGQLGRLQEAAQKAFVDVRQAILGLRTPSWQNHGLLEALNEYVRNLNEQGELCVRIESGEGTHVRDLAPAIEVQAIRIIQEALSNIRKHSQARGASIHFREDDAWLTISIRDDGQGFDLPGAYGRQDHFGLKIMRERAESVGGRLTVDTAPGEGTALTVQLPREGGR